MSDDIEYNQEMVDEILLQIDEHENRETVIMSDTRNSKEYSDPLDEIDFIEKNVASHKMG